MNLQTHHSGQSQAGTMLPGLMQQSGNPSPNQMQNPSMRRHSPEEVEKARYFMQQKILDFLMHRRQQTHEVSQNKMIDLVKRLEEGLYKNFTTMDDFVNLNTLESRLHVLIKPMTNHSQQFSHANSHSTMIPTPGMSQSGNSSMVGNSAVDNSLVANNTMTSSNANSGGYMQTGNGPPVNVQSGSFSSSYGALSRGYQPPSSTFSGGNTMATSMGVQRMTSQMIPTPGFNNPGNNNVNSNANDLTNNVGAFPAVDSTSISQPMQQKQGQNSRILRNIGGHLGGEIRSTLQQKPYGLSNGPLSGGLVNNTPMINGPGSSEGYLTGTMYENSNKTLRQHQRPIVQGDGYGIGSSDATGNLYTPTSIGSMMNNPSLNPGSMQMRNTPMTTNQSNLHSTQHPTNLIKHEPLDQSEKLNFHSQYSNTRENLVQQPQQPQQQFQQPSNNNQFQRQQLVQNQKQQNQNQIPPKNDTFVVSSNPVSESKSEQQISDPFQFQQKDSYPQEFAANPNNSEFVCVSGQWYSKSQNSQDEFNHRLTRVQDVAQLNNLSSEESVIGQTELVKNARNHNRTRAQEIKNQQRWILFMMHARRCPSALGKCKETHCEKAQKLLNHIKCCNGSQCDLNTCRSTKTVIKHFQDCKNSSCPVCIPVRNFMKANAKVVSSPNFNSKSYDNAENQNPGPSPTPVVIPETKQDDIQQPCIKRTKIEQVSRSLVSASESSVAMIPPINEPGLPHNEQNRDSHHVPVKQEIAAVKMEVSGSVGGRLSSTYAVIKKDDNSTYVPRAESDPIASNKEVDKIEKEMGKAKLEIIPSETASKSGKPKIKGVSMTELFTPEQVRQHILGLRQWVGQSKAKVEKNQAMEHSMSENSCQLCAVEKLTFEPPPIYCTPCGARIKRNAMYYTIGAGETRHSFCIPCYNEARGDTIVVDGTAISKSRVEKKKNDEETEEWWVQCDKCEAWQHQICALFNGRRNDGEAEYTCPNCYMVEVENGERSPLSQNAVLGAKDLPRTILSDHMEQRLFAKLKQERMDRARSQGKSYDEVPGADSLVIRVVSSVDKKLEVKPRFLEIFQEENYPIEFPYKSKVILLFQKIEGVEVCLFGMYVQEFGSECLQPNHRRVYLSYLDSVKYFRPDVRAVTGEALRTYVYHEILIGYLDYCKKRGFASCYIWACPPLKGEDYILYCHPEIQKTPKSDKLREWYLAMLRKAKEEKIVAELTNLYDHFFVTNGESRAKVTAARLPYFDGDYWPGAAEDMIFQLQQEEDGRKHNKKGSMKKTITKRALKASGQTDLTGNASKDLMLMHKLGETISPMKEDFIMVHLHFSCTHCCILMVSGNRWVCKQCKNFQLCDKCYDAERKREDRERHPIHHRDKHALYPFEISGVTEDTKDEDDILESEFFDTRQAFLSLCQGNHYQYDTLRRAKHSSMMVLYHLHNPTAPAFVSTCNQCHLDLESGQGWRCETCPEYDLCNSCYQKGVNHPHKLTSYASSDRDDQNTEARELRVTQLRKMLDLLVHASQCRSPQCQYPNCRKVKGLFRHGMLCKVRASGGCVLCKKMWYLLQLHARACKESECNVPRCRDLKEHIRRLQQQSDSRRRAAVMEMMRQRAAEVAGSS